MRGMIKAPLSRNICSLKLLWMISWMDEWMNTLNNADLGIYSRRQLLICFLIQFVYWIYENFIKFILRYMYACIYIHIVAMKAWHLMHFLIHLLHCIAQRNDRFQLFSHKNLFFDSLNKELKKGIIYITTTSREIFCMQP